MSPLVVLLWPSQQENHQDPVGGTVDQSLEQEVIYCFLHSLVPKQCHHVEKSLDSLPLKIYRRIIIEVEKRQGMKYFPIVVIMRNWNGQNK